VNTQTRSKESLLLCYWGICQ